MTAKDLLYKIFEYQYLWAGNSPDKCPPAKLRFAQIESLANAFGVYKVENTAEKQHRVVSYIISGDFLSERKALDISLTQKITAFIEKHFPSAKEMGRHMLRDHDIRWLFNDLVNYRQEMYKVTRPWDGMLEGFSGGLHYAKYLQYQLNTIIKDSLTEIDDTLWVMVDPERRTLDVLPAGYPSDEDVRSAELDWLMDNY